MLNLWYWFKHRFSCVKSLNCFFLHCKLSQCFFGQLQHVHCISYIDALLIYQGSYKECMQTVLCNRQLSKEMARTSTKTAGRILHSNSQFPISKNSLFSQQTLPGVFAIERLLSVACELGCCCCYCLYSISLCSHSFLWNPNPFIFSETDLYRNVQKKSNSYAVV